ncbi:Transmembrane protein 45B [Bulinus truncatus]|nr:Transmembrane protein 45B [Bulinus truncatus]
MGDLKGHAIPGTFFIIYGTWWAIGCLWRYVSGRRSRETYVSTATYRMTCFSGAVSRLPLEPFIKVLLSASGILYELLTELPVPPPAIVQHATMYFFFLLSGIVDIIIHYGVHLPHGVDYVSMVLALTVEGLLFMSHVHGRTHLDVHVHTLLVYVIGITAVVIILEIKYRSSLMLTLARSFLMMLQGSWFWAIGIKLYGHGSPNNVWDENSPESVIWSSIYFR